MSRAIPKNRLQYQWQGTPVIFVFGSNLSGIHGAGAAKDARLRHGAVWGVGRGATGQSYALPTKGYAPQLPTLSLGEIFDMAGEFKHYAATHPELYFQLTAVGCGLAGHHPRTIAPLFSDTTPNVFHPPEWRNYLNAAPQGGFWSYGQFGW